MRHAAVVKIVFLRRLLTMNYNISGEMAGGRSLNQTNLVRNSLLELSRGSIANKEEKHETVEA